MIYYFIAIAVIALDQITKYFVVRYMDIGESIPLIDNVLYLTSHRNAGAAFGILQGQMWLFFIATIIVVSIIVYLMITQVQGSKWFGTSLGLVLGGAIGNFIDRMLAGEVVDFIDVFIFAYNYPIFNVADMALVTGVIMMMIHFIKEDRKEKKQGK
ncbi:signal peptidase II [Salisediminibacterium halotolerans]|uniref:signal peptidase II n=1 Tax=Salisediminibacterium halotolerans TaxID=517425 RepID=UPI000EAD385C|nr:signal peptidase II [Salisediminibacterium halotolerans]RLJ74293.1 signal peptidase II [Actinophytocola xinjiangensis]RPE87614.1 signal peptidase II [Salisediminibacterium halotolerans]TWG35130.1 signal peptidase II [Salisediminibacterium halotolerans]GEL07311.1 lipoprotein signal peptidase [Salisediminibacterium halotolerans]